MRRLHVATLCLSQLFGLFFFARGFFPLQKAAIKGYASTNSLDVPPVFDRLIFIVIDALRADFAFGPDSSMHNLHRKILEGEALAFTARASTPTVTLPRLKCLTTGSISGFLDAVLNLAEADESSAKTIQDSWVYQQVAQGKKIRMYGDDTWLRLFPNAFAETDGTTSFFVSDFKQVDNNVTRHIEPALSSQDWDTIILHYLGLDHIGHLSGPDSKDMPIKQMEMDEIIDQIHAFIKDQDKMNGHSTAIVVVGDHGMTVTGNHGGASDAETLTAAFIISERLKELTLGQTWPAHQQGTYEFYRTILQSDFVPMLSMLTGTPIPVNSIGKVPIIALGLWRDSKDRLRALRQNARQLQQLLLAGGISKRIRTTLPCTKGPENAECDLAQLDFAFNSSEADERDLLEALDVMQIILKASSNDYSMPDMFLGLGILGSTALVALTSYLFAFRSRFELLLLLVPVGYAATAFASSFVEEEQVFWYFLTAALLSVVQYAHARQSASLHLNTALTTMAPLLLFRLLRRFNQTGQKHAGMDDLSAWLKYEPVLFDRLLIATFLATGLLLSRRARLNLAWSPFYLAFGSIAFFKLSSHSGYGGLADVWIAKPLSAWLSMGIGSILVRLQRSSSATTSLLQVLAALIFCLQARIDNLPILLLLLGIARSLRDNKGILRPAWLEKCIFIVLCSLQQSSFFAMGNSNALSGLDLSQAYNGIGSYNAVLVGLLLFISSFLGAFFWQVEIIVWTRRPAQNTEPDRGSFARAYMIVLSTSYAFALCLSCHILRHHLFVYSVFSPKLLYEIAWSLFYTLASLSI